MTGNDNFEDDYQKLFDETLNQYERSQSKQISDDTEKSVPPASRFAKDEKTNKKPITQGQKTGIMLMSFGLLITATGLLITATAVINYKTSEKKERVNKQVEAYEKTLPADYLEYKQAVEHYRDSLMHDNGR